MLILALIGLFLQFYFSWKDKMLTVSIITGIVALVYFISIFINSSITIGGSIFCFVMWSISSFMNYNIYRGKI